MNFLGDLVVDDPLRFCDFLEGVFAANVFGFGRYSCFLFHRVRWAGLRRGSLSTCLVTFGLSEFGWLIRLEVGIVCI